MSFSTDIAKFILQTKTDADKVCRAIKLSLFNGIIRDTRVNTGRLRGNWQTSRETPKHGDIERLDKTGVEAMKEAADNITGFGTNHMVNNLPYAEVWEERDGMIAKNLQRVQRNMEKAVKEVTR
jgi:hypothetical protein